MSRVDWIAVAKGAGVAAAVTWPAGIIQSAVGHDSSAVFPLFLVIVVGLVAGGFVAGRPHPERGMTHGAIASIASFLAIQSVATVIKLVRGDPTDPARLIFTAMIASSLGLLGGYLAYAQAARRGDIPEGEPHEEAPL